MEQLVAMPHAHRQDHHFAPAQPLPYKTYGPGTSGLNGFGPVPHPMHSYPPNMLQSPQFAPGNQTYMPGFDHRFPDPQRSFCPMPGYHVGQETKGYPSNHFHPPYQPAMFQKQHAFNPADVHVAGPFNGMLPAMHNSYGYIPHQGAHYNIHPHQGQSFHGHSGPVPAASSSYPSPVSPSYFQSSHLAGPPSPQGPRGPPRKPKRSGHAIWVGNIPMGASIEDLKDHFSRNATDDIESVFLMSKSNCAFVNYVSEKACHAAVERFNHSLFGSVRLLCRIRREPSTNREGSQSSGSVRRSPMPTESTISSAASSNEKLDDVTESFTGLGISQDDEANPSNTSPPPAQQPLPVKTKPADRYFVLKSLTKEDLQDSLIKGTWETQSHNQQILHDAFLEAENIYLIFSVNKSGEYFGYARMLSSPFDGSSQQSDSPSTETTSSSHRLKQTPATSTAPRGYIIDDPTRGTLFWEAEHSTASNIVSSDGVRPPNVDFGQPRSRPFQIEWLSVRRVTFQRTKGMRNLWNANKEVKVARDGTELETEVGKRVVGLFCEESKGAGGQ